MSFSTARGLVLAPLALTLVAGLSAQEQVRSGQRITLGSGPVEIFDAVGTVTVTRASGRVVEVTATARGADGNRLQFFTDTEGGRSRFRVVFPEVDRIAAPEGRQGRWNGGRTTLRLRSDGTFGGSDNGSRWRRAGGDEIEIGGTSGFRGWADLEIAVPEGADVIVRLAVGHASVSGADARRGVIDLWSADAEARDISGDWLFDTGSGDVTVTNARGTLTLDTGSGSGTVTGMRGDLLDIDTGSGNVEVTDVQVTRCRFDTGSGNVRARRITAPRCVADTGSGDVDLEYSGGTIDDLVIDTGSGRALLTMPPGTSARVLIDTGSGDVVVNRSGAVFERRDSDGVVLRFGDGRGRIAIDTGSGDVVIR